MSNLSIQSPDLNAWAAASEPLPSSGSISNLSVGAIAVNIIDGVQVGLRVAAAVEEVKKNGAPWPPANSLDIWVKTYNLEKDRAQLRISILNGLNIIAYVECECDGKYYQQGQSPNARAAQRLIAELESSCGWRYDGKLNPVLPPARP